MNALSMIFRILIVFALATEYGFAQYYYGDGNMIPLKIDSSKIVVQFDSDVDINARQALINSIERIDSAIADDHALDGFPTWGYSDTSRLFSFSANQAREFSELLLTI